MLGLVVLADEVDHHVTVLQGGHDGLLVPRAERQQAQLDVCMYVCSLFKYTMLCMYVCMDVCMYVCACIVLKYDKHHACMDVCVCECTYELYVYVCTVLKNDIMYTCMHVRMYVYLSMISCMYCLYVLFGFCHGLSA